MVLKDGLPQMLPYGQINLVKEITAQMPDYGATIDGWINMNYNFLGLDLTANPSTGFTGFHLEWACIGLILIPVLAGLSQFALSFVTMKQNPQQEGAAARSTRSMMYMMPLFSVYIAFIMPAALGIYWIAQSAFSAAWAKASGWRQRLTKSAGSSPTCQRRKISGAAWLSKR